MEEWKDVSEYEGLYQVSNTGRVRSYYSGTWKIMKQSTRKGGYKKLFLRKNKERKSFFIHRLVATAFIPNPDASKEVLPVVFVQQAAVPPLHNICVYEKRNSLSP